VANTPKNIGEIYAERALQGDQEGPPSSVQPQPERAVYPITSTGPVIYGGTMPSPSSQDEFARQALATKKKATGGRKLSPFNLMLMMIGLAVVIVLYIGNVIAVQQLLKEVSDEQAKLQQILNEQEMLKAQINRMSSLERIRKMAEDDLGLHNPKGAPQWIEVDGDKVKQIQEELSSQQPPSAQNTK
jgi:cell division protein FtsL